MKSPDYSCSLICVLIASLFCSSKMLRADQPNSLMAEGTLAYHLSTNTAAHAAGRSANMGDLLEFTAPNSPGLERLTKATWSQSFWLKDVRGLGATPIGFTNLAGGQGLPTMVSPRHYLCATHMHPEGYLIAFLDTNNVIFWRRTLQRVDIGNDISVGILDKDLPPSVGFLPVLAANYTNYLLTTRYIQGVGMNQDMCLFSQPMYMGTGALISWNSSETVLLGPTKNWNIALRPGDSSNPEMLLIRDQLVLVAHNYFASAGPNYAMHINEINKAMHQISIRNHAKTDYQLTQYSLAGWPTIH